jgi:hypothetical protein
LQNEEYNFTCEGYKTTNYMVGAVAGCCLLVAIITGAFYERRVAKLKKNDYRRMIEHQMRTAFDQRFDLMREAVAHIEFRFDAMQKEFEERQNPVVDPEPVSIEDALEEAMSDLGTLKREVEAAAQAGNTKSRLGFLKKKTEDVKIDGIEMTHKL